MSDLAPGSALGSYCLDGVIGRGGTGVVYHARRAGREEPLVVKVLKSQLRDDPVQRRRFEREARAAQEVMHPSLVPIIDAGEVDGHCFLAMPFVGATTLKDRIVEHGRLPVSEVVGIAGALGGALDALHAGGLVHRDVKPSNVLLETGTGRPLLGDFGIAKGTRYTALTRTGQWVGTPAYLAPELFRGEPGSGRSDVYALACLLYECLVGEPPFGVQPVLQVGFGHLRGEVPDPCRRHPGLRPATGRALLRGLEKEPERRPGSGGALAEALRATTA